MIENEEVKIEIEEKPSCVVELKVSALPTLVKNSRRKAIKAIAKEVDLPGFRKGKAPEDMLLKKFPEHIEEKWQKQIADDAFVAAQKLKHIPVLNNSTPITFNMIKHSLDDGAEMTFSFESEPSPPSIDFSKFHLKEVERKEVGQKELDEYLRQVQLMYAQFKPIEDRALKENDFVILDLETLEEPKSKIFSDTRFEITKEKMADWMRNLIVGQKSGAIIEGVSKPDEDAKEEEKKDFAEKKVRVTIKKIEEPVVMELNDDFARGLNFGSFEELKNYAEKMLNDKADQGKELEERKQVNDFLINNFPFDLPVSLVNAEVNHRKKQYLDNPAHKANLDKMTPEERKAFDEKILKESKEAVSIFFLSRKVCQEANLPIEYEEIEQESRALMAQSGIHPKSGEEQKIPDEVKALSLSRVLLRKAQDHILQVGKKA